MADASASPEHWQVDEPFLVERVRWAGVQAGSDSTRRFRCTAQRFRCQ